MKDYHYMIDVLANTFITVMTQFRMVAEHLVHRRQEGPHHKEHQQLSSAGITSLPVPVGVLRLGIHQQRADATSTCFLFQNNKHTRENNKQSLQGPTTTFKNWAAEVQIYMALEDHNLANIMEDIKTEKVAINDVNYVDFRLREQGLGQKDAEEIRDNELQRLLRLYTTRTEPIKQRNAERRARRQARIEYHNHLQYQIRSNHLQISNKQR
eukprot:3548965-Amphidinium_carterae.1